MEEYIEAYISIANAHGTNTADNELVSVEDLTPDEMREVKRRALKLIDERELEQNLGGDPQTVGSILMGQTPEKQQQIMIEELIRENATDSDKLRSLKEDIEKSDLSEQVKTRLYRHLDFLMKVMGNSDYIQALVLQQGDPLAPRTPQILSEYVEPEMRFTRSIINSSIENAMRYLP